MISKLYDEVVMRDNVQDDDQGGDVNVGEGSNDDEVQGLNDDQGGDVNVGEGMNNDEVHGLNHDQGGEVNVGEGLNDVGEVYDEIDIDQTNIGVLNTDVSLALRIMRMRVIIMIVL